MLQKLGYKQKLIGLLSAIALLLVGGYFLSVKKTITVIAENKTMARLTQSNEVELLGKIRTASRQKQQIDSLKEVFSGSSSQSKLIKALFESADRYSLNVSEFGSFSDRTLNDPALYKLQVEGLYVNMVKHLRQIESEFFFCEIESVRAFSEVDRRSKKEKLFMDIIIKQQDYGKE